MRVKNPQQYVCPRGHNMLVHEADNEYRCIECDRNSNTWRDAPFFSHKNIFRVDAGPTDPLGRMPSCVGDVGRRLNVHAGMLPFHNRSYDRAKSGLAIADYIDQLPEYRQTFKIRQIAPMIAGEEYIADLNEIDMTHTCSDRLWLSHGVQPHDNITKQNKSYLNPNYVHYDATGPPKPLGSESEVRYWTMLYATMGTVDREVPERNLGIDSVYDYAPHWDERREYGRVWLANTFRVLDEWTGWPRGKIARAYGTTPSRIEQLVDTHADLERVPPDPSYSSKFGRASRQPEGQWPELGGEKV